MRIEIHLLEQSQAMVFTEVTNAYTKGGLYCIYKDGMVTKFPLCNIFRIVESYKELKEDSK